MNSPVFSPTTDQRSVQLLVASVALVAAPHFLNLATSIMGFFSLLLLWRFAAARRTVAMPRRPLLFLLTLTGAALVFAEYHRFYGREAGAALLCVGLGLKLMELRSTRDAYLAIFLAFFVAITQYLFSQTIPMALYTVVVVVLLVTSMISLNSSPAFPLEAQLKMGGLFVLQAVPLMLVLFLLFPRIPGPLWKLPDDQPRAKSGLSDTMEPGAIARLGLSREPAFRVQFEGAPPPPRLRYWRGPVFWQTDGKRWTLLAEKDYGLAVFPTVSGSARHYSIILEPNGQRWVFALDLPTAFPGELMQSAEYLLLARDKITERRQYRLGSHTEYATGAISEREKRLGLQVPATPSPRLEQLVGNWRRGGASPRNLVERALAYFRQEPFFYTLNPPLTSGDPVESFLFETRRGFCEHYATSFVMLMRMAGVPARVVTGYQGGEWNELGHFLQVRQADAHAWAEVWLQDKGWTRIDPTAAVAPGRIESGLDLDSQVAAGEIRFNPLAEALADQAFRLRDVFKQARMLWNSVDYAWNLWVLSYGPENQARLLSALGIVDWQKLAWWLSALLALVLTAMAWLILPDRSRRHDEVEKLYRRFLVKLARRGFNKAPAEGALSFSQHLAPQLPRQAAAIQRITDLFLELRYGRPGSPARIKTLRLLVKQLRL